MDNPQNNDPIAFRAVAFDRDGNECYQSPRFDGEGAAYTMRRIHESNFPGRTVLVEALYQ